MPHFFFKLPCTAIISNVLYLFRALRCVLTEVTQPNIQTQTSVQKWKNFVEQRHRFV